jgi:uncharacterized protein (DUF488 family)
MSSPARRSRNQPRPGAVFTIGHGTRALDDFVSVLTTAAVDRLVDVRRYPGSKRNPQFSRPSLEAGLSGAGVVYDFRGDELGGRRPEAIRESRHPAWRVAAFRNYADYMDTDEFETAMDDLESDVRSGSRLCLMCAETLWWRCHRRLIADALVMRGYSVVHLIDRDHEQQHRLHESARPDDRNLPVYDGGHTRRLPI